MKLCSKPSTEHALTLAASAVHLLLIGDEQVRLVDAPDYPEVKIRPHGGRWPLVTSTEEVDVSGDSNHACGVLFRFTMERGSSWVFAADTRLTVILD